MGRPGFVQVQGRTKEQGDQFVAPQLRPDQIPGRVGSAFDTALREMIRQYFTPTQDDLVPGHIFATELAAVRNLMEAARRSAPRGTLVDPIPILQRYIDQNPDSWLAYFRRHTRTFDWVLTDRGEVRFDQALLTRDVTQYYAMVRQEIIRAVSVLYANTHLRESTAGVRGADRSLDTDVTACSFLAGQLGAFFQQEPLVQVVPTYRGADIVFASSFTQPAQHVDVGDDESKSRLHKIPRRQ